jgi:ribosome biogenesis protein BMS1
MFIAQGKSRKLTKEDLQEKKRKLKEKFDAEYDDRDGGKTYYDELKQEVDQQAQVPVEPSVTCQYCML